MFEWVARQVAETGLLGVFVLMVAENIFPPIPSEIIMAASGFAAARGDISLIGTIIVAVLGTLVGNASGMKLAAGSAWNAFAPWSRAMANGLPLKPKIWTGRNAR